MANDANDIGQKDFDDSDFQLTQLEKQSLDILAIAVLATEEMEKQHGLTLAEMRGEMADDDDAYGWAYLPQILLEDIFVMLTPKYRHVASQVCWRWYHMFYSPRVWEKLTLDANRLSIRHTQHWNRLEMVTRRVQMCVARVGHLFKHVVIQPISDYYSLHQFLRILASFLEFNDDSGSSLLRRFELVFACETHGVAQFGSIVHGTGGQILEQLIAVMNGLRDLERLKLNDLLLEVDDAFELLHTICDKHHESLTYMELLNFTKSPFPLPLITIFSALSILSLSPQQLDEEVVLLLAATVIQELRIVQDKYTQSALPVSAEAWKELRQSAPFLSVRLEVRGATRDAVLIQPSAPVKVVVFSTPYSQLSSASTVSICDHYADTLEVYAQESLPKVRGSRSFHERGDANLLMIANRCRHLRTLIIHDRVSTCTALLVSHRLGRACKKLIFRRNALIKRCDWPRASSWTQDFYSRLKIGSRCYDHMSRQISEILGRAWRPLSDAEFKKIKI